MTPRDPGRDVSEVLAELGMDYPRMTQDEIDAHWDRMAAYVRRSTDEELLAAHEGMDAEAVACWRHLAANPPQQKSVIDFRYRPVKGVA